jgi:hypothetical protein
MVELLTIDRGTVQDCMEACECTEGCHHFDTQPDYSHVIQTLFNADTDGRDHFGSGLPLQMMVSCKMHTTTDCTDEFEGDSEGTYVRTAGAAEANVDKNIGVCIMRNFREVEPVPGYVRLAQFSELSLTCLDAVLEPAVEFGGWSSVEGMCRVQCETTDGCVGFTVGVGEGNAGECILRSEVCVNAGNGGKPFTGHQLAGGTEFYWRVVGDVQVKMAAAPPPQTNRAPGVVGGSMTCLCSTSYDPVCGTDGITYSNTGCADCADVGWRGQGLCDDHTDETLSSSCSCSLLARPSCGINGVTYTNPGCAACENIAIASFGVCSGSTVVESASTLTTLLMLLASISVAFS